MCFLFFCLKERKKLKNKLKKIFKKGEDLEFPIWMGHPDVDEGLLPMSPLTVNDVIHSGEGPWYVHSKTGDILRCSSDMMVVRERVKEKRIVEDMMEKEAKELRKAELKEENIKKYGKGK